MDLRYGLFIVHVMVRCIEGLYELWRVREMYTLTQVERQRTVTTKFSKAWGDSGWSSTRWIHWCLAHSTFFAENLNGGTFFSFPPSQRSIGMGLTSGGSKIVSRVGPW